MTIATDDVDAMLVEKPGRIDLRFIRRFMVVFGIISSVFDYATFGVLLYIEPEPKIALMRRRPGQCADCRPLSELRRRLRRLA